MGSRLVAVAIRQQGITKPARLVLVQMAVLARDTDTPPVYWGGWQMLGACLGHDPYGDNASVLAVKRAVRELVRTGLVKPLGAPGPGHNVTYELRLSTGR